MARRLLGQIPRLCDRAREGTRRRGEPSRCRDRLRGAEDQSAPRRDARAHRRDRRTLDRPRRREGDHKRKARRARSRRRHRCLCHCHDPPALDCAMIDPETRALAVRVLDACRARQWMVATAESCTGGLVAGVLTDIAGSSDVLDRGFVTYSNAAKMAMLGVPEATLRQFGAVSRQAAMAMASGALARADVNLTVSITGVAGPRGGTPEKPVGLVHFAVATNDGGLMHREKRYGDIGRSEVRRASVIEALNMLLEFAA